MTRAANGDFVSARNGYEQLRRVCSAGLCLGFGLATMAYPFLAFPSPGILALTTTRFVLLGLGITAGAGIMSRKMCGTAKGLAAMVFVAAVTATLFCLITTFGCS
ncbi:MAG: hypothetical protein QCH35_07605 [Methanomicrobiaceae archaeon]|nr:hypothetical protein [Methanomicrobiaceae archaeon]